MQRPSSNLARSWQAIVLLVGLGPITAAVAQPTEQPAEVFAQAARYFEQGEFEAAIVSWRKMINPSMAANEALKIGAHLAIAAACQRVGLYEEARLVLADAEALLKNRNDSELTAQFHLQAGNLSLAANHYPQALESLSAASAQAALTERPELHALILNDYGNALAASGYSSDAIAAYAQARELALQAGASPIALAAAINVARAQSQRGDATATSVIAIAENQWRETAPTFEWAMAGLALVELRRQAGVSSREADLETLRKIEDYAALKQSTRLLAAVNLSLGDVVGEPALRRAIFFASQAQAADVLYEAHWRLAQLQRRTGRLDAAVDSFERALAALNPVRDELLSGTRDSQRFFQARIRPVYTDFVDALMSSAASANQSQRTARLERARNAIEALRGAELQDYFRDECVANTQIRSLTMEQATQGAAVLYPIVLADRLELLLTIGGELHRRTVDVTQEQLTETTLRLREFVQDGSHERFRPYATRLHRWLIEPLRSELEAANINTLVVIPDGVLRTVPFAVLHDGGRYLIEDFAVAVTPSLKLTALTAPNRSNNILLAGVAQPVQGFAPLPQVSTELQSIQGHLGGRILSDRDYTKQNLQTALQSGAYNIIHMATHGTFSAAAGDSFLLTYDDRLTMTDLEAALRGDRREPRIDLLTLSACETAIGDERAALGLAGMAVKSGAASVVASLWKVDDAATAALMDHFYGQLQKSGVGKARALRSAQLGMLANAQYTHPAHWAAFMLIGSWQ